MAGFDPYYRWLSISPEEQPPTLYRLLGLRPFEDNPDVIENAADRQMTHLRTYQSGKHSEASQKLLNEIAAAKLNLLNLEKKAQYDKLLRQQTALADEGSEPDEELSTTLAGFLEAIEFVKEEQAKAKKIREKAKPADPRKSEIRRKRSKRSEAATASAGKKAREKGKSAESRGPDAKRTKRRDRAAKRTPGQQDETAAEPTATDQKRRERTILITSTIGIGVLVLLALGAWAFLAGRGPKKPAPPVTVLTDDGGQAKAGAAEKHSLVFDFETGDLQGWKVVEGEFDRIICDREFRRNKKDEKHNKQGEYYLTTTEQAGGEYDDKMTGVVESPVFVLTDPDISMLVGGGSGFDTYVAICLTDGKEVLAARGKKSEVMRRIDWHMPQLVGKTVFVRIVDRATGDWGHVTFDDFRAGGKIDAAATEKRFSERLAIAKPAPAREKPPVPTPVVKPTPAREKPPIPTTVAKPDPVQEEQPTPTVVDKPKPVLLPEPALPEEPKRVPVPPRDEQEKMARQIEEFYEFPQLKTAAEKLSLAEKLFDLGKKSQGGAAEKFVLLRKAMELAQSGGDPVMTVRAIDAIGESFAVDALDVKQKVLNKFVSDTLDAEQIKSFMEAVRPAIDEALGEGRHGIAVDLAETACRLTKRTAGREFRGEAHQRLDRVRGLASRFEQLQAAPDDPAANLALGRWFCFERGDWKQGLPHLAKCGNPTLKDLAAQERTFSGTPADQVKLADAWWALAERAEGGEADALMIHAGDWYRKTLPDLPEGIVKAKTEKRLAEIAKIERPADKPGRPNELPADGLVLHLDADAFTGLNDGDPIARWDDRSGGGNHATQSEKSRRPAYCSSGLGDKPVVRFDGDDFLATSTAFATPYTIFSVSQMEGTKNGRLITSASAGWLLGYGGGKKDVMRAGAWVKGEGGPAADTIPHLYAASGTRAKTVFYEGGNLLASSSWGVSGIGRLKLGGGTATGNSELSKGDVAEIIIYNRALSVEELNAVGSYLANKYGLSTSYAGTSSAVADAQGRSKTVRGVSAKLAPGLVGIYFEGKKFEKMLEVRIDPTVGLGWARSEGAKVPPSNYSISWRGWLVVPSAGRYTFTIFSDDGHRLWLDGALLAEKWSWKGSSSSTHQANKAANTTSVTVNLKRKSYLLRFDFYQATGATALDFKWQRQGGFAEQDVPAEVLFHTRGPLDKSSAGAKR